MGALDTLINRKFVRAYDLSMKSNADAIADFNEQAALDGWPIRADSGLEFEAAELIEALKVWRVAASGRAIPARSDVTPLAMKTFLPKVAVVDILREPSHIRFRARLSGTALDRTYGIKNGAIFDEILPEPSRGRWQKTFELPLLANGPVRTWGRVGFNDMTFLSAETFLAPMGTSHELPDAILAVVHVSQFRGH